MTPGGMIVALALATLLGAYLAAFAAVALFVSGNRCRASDFAHLVVIGAVAVLTLATLVDLL